MRRQRYCLRFYCDFLRERICCADCPFREGCRNPCLNHPVRCRLEDVPRRKTVSDSDTDQGEKENVSDSDTRR